MFRPMAFVAILALVALQPMSSAGESPIDPARPLSASAILMQGSALLTWVPSPLPADSFQIYGVTSTGTLSPLTTATPDTISVTVPLGFSGYAVTAWHEGVQSNATNAALSVYVPCATVGTGVPPPVFIGSCGTSMDKARLGTQRQL